MDVDAITWGWLIFGIVMMISEIFVPGLVVIFLGLAAIIVAAGRWSGLIEGILNSFTYWFILSLGIVMGLRGIVSKFFPGQTSKKAASDDEEAVGRIVEVLEEVGSDHENGRIRFRGTTWKACSEYGRIFPGQKAKIYARRDMVWIVDPLDDSAIITETNSLAVKIAGKSKAGDKKGRRFFIRSLKFPWK